MGNYRTLLYSFGENDNATLLDITKGGGVDLTEYINKYRENGDLAVFSSNRKIDLFEAIEWVIEKGQDVLIKKADWFEYEERVKLNDLVKANPQTNFIFTFEKQHWRARSSYPYSR